MEIIRCHLLILLRQLGSFGACTGCAHAPRRVIASGCSFARRRCPQGRETVSSVFTVLLHLVQLQYIPTFAVCQALFSQVGKFLGFSHDGEGFRRRCAEGHGLFPRQKSGGLRWKPPDGFFRYWLGLGISRRGGRRFYRPCNPRFGCPACRRQTMRGDGKSARLQHCAY